MPDTVNKADFSLSKTAITSLDNSNNLPCLGVMMITV